MKFGVGPLTLTLRKRPELLDLGNNRAEHPGISFSSPNAVGGVVFHAVMDLKRRPAR